MTHLLIGNGTNGKEHNQLVTNQIDPNAPPNGAPSITDTHINYTNPKG